MLESRETVEFQKLHNGLGFHPFEEGLPYSSPPRSAPVARAPVSAPPTVAPPAPPAVTASVTATPKLGLAYSLARAGAYLVDLAFHFSLLGAFFGLSAWKLEVSPRVFVDDGALPFTLMTFFLLHSAFLAAEEISLRTSLGKEIFGLRIQGSPARLLLRAMLFPISLGALGLGLLSSLSDRRGRAWHDRWSDVSPLPR